MSARPWRKRRMMTPRRWRKVVVAEGMDGRIVLNALEGREAMLALAHAVDELQQNSAAMIEATRQANDLLTRVLVRR